MLDLEYKKFEPRVEKEADYTPEYQITKLADDTYQIYSFSERSASIKNSNSTLKAIASLRGGSYLDAHLANAVLDMDKFSSITVTADALAITKTAAVSSDEEPWELVSLNGNEYFIKSTAAKEVKELEEKESVKKTAAVKHTYLVKVQTHNITELAKIASFAEDTLCAKPNSFETTGPTVAVFEVATPESSEMCQQEIIKKLIESNIILPDTNVQVFKDNCPCGCGKEPCASFVPVDAIEEKPQGYVLTTLESPKIVTASKKETLEAYAAAHYKDYIIKSADGAVVNKKEASAQEVDETSFAKILSDHLIDNYKKAHINKKAEDQVLVDTTTGQVLKPGEEPQDGKEYDVAKVTDLNAVAAEEPNDAQTSQEDEGSDVRRWKGLKQDEDTGKFVVYITEQEERVFDTAEEALSFMMRE